MQKLLALPEKVKYIISSFEREGYSAFAVGGAIRNMVLGIPVKDWDIVVTAAPEITKKMFENTIATGEAYGTITVLLDGEPFEVTTARIEEDYEDNRHPSNVEYSKSIEEDLARRDFTMNAIAFDGERFIDPYNGITDIENKLIRCVGQPEERFKEDALRILRAFRFAATLGFVIEEETANAAKKFATTLCTISKERIRNEMQKILLSNNPEVLEELIISGGIAHLGVIGVSKNYTFISLQNVTQNMLLRWWAFTKITNTNIEVLCQELQFSKPFLRAMQQTEKMFRDLQPITVKQMKHFLKNGTPAPQEDLFAAFYALDTSFIQQKKLVDQLVESKEPYQKNMVPVSGGDLLAHGINGKQVGEVLEFLLDTVIETPALNKHSVLIEIAKKVKRVV